MTGALLASCTGCGAAAPVAAPPAVELPVRPAEETPKTAAASASAAPATPGAPGPAPWVLRSTRTEATKAMTRCQIAPFTFGATIAVEEQLVDGGQLAMRVVQDDETERGLSPVPVLLGKGYRVEGSSQGLQVHGEGGATVPDDQAARIRALAATFVGWPGGEVVAHRPTAGSEVTVLEAPVATIAAVPLHGAQVEGESKAVVRFASARQGDGGPELVFDVAVQARGSDAGMCHRWTNAADLKGELRLRASNGALLELHLEGTTEDTEGLCQDPSGKPGPPPPPHTCNRGQVSVEVRQPRVP